MRAGQVWWRQRAAPIPHPPLPRSIHQLPLTSPSLPASPSFIWRRYGDGSVRLTVEENVILPGVPEAKLVALQADPLFQRFPIHGGELSFLHLSFHGGECAP